MTSVMTKLTLPIPIGKKNASKKIGPVNAKYVLHTVGQKIKKSLDDQKTREIKLINFTKKKIFLNIFHENFK